MRTDLIEIIPYNEWQRLIGNITYKLAAKFGYQDIEDLNQEAWLAIYYASTKFDDKKNVKFTTYASICIFHHIFKILKKKNSSNIEDEYSIIANEQIDENLTNKLSELLEEPLLKAYFVDHKTYEQIAKEINQCAGVAHKKVKLAIEEAKKKIENY